MLIAVGQVVYRKDKVMFCSTIIPTIGRTSLNRAVESVLSQDAPDGDFEAIVVNDTGVPLPESPWQHDERVRVMTTNRTERSVARNAGAAIALGEYLHFLDDDDWLLPGALAEFKKLATQNEEALIYGTAELVDREGRHLVKLNLNVTGNCFVKVMAGEWIPIGSFMVKRDAFLGIGGFQPLISVGEDIDFCRRIALRHDFAHTSTSVVSVLRGDSWDSSTLQELAASFSRWGVDRILNEKGSFRRLRDSADSRYWWGRICRLYLGSALWNVQKSHVLRATGRFLLGGLGFFLANGRVLSGRFWKGFGTPHVSNVR